MKQAGPLKIKRGIILSIASGQLALSRTLESVCGWEGGSAFPTGLMLSKLVD